MRFQLFVPAPGSLAETTIAAGSALIGTPQPNGRVSVDFEGNLHGYSNVATFADLAVIAAGRHQTSYPTIARRSFPADAVVAVGEFDAESGEVDVDPEDLDKVLAWTGLAPEQWPAQRLSTSMRHQARREIHGALASPDPRRREAGRLMARRLNIQLP